ncbi:MAG: hypothetical protein RRY54_06230, partial [Angelakisella sp.]
SVYQKYLNRNLTPDTLTMPDVPQKNGPPLVVVSEGRVNEDYLRLCGRDRKWLDGIVASYHLPINAVYLMTVDAQGSVNLIEKSIGGRA